MVEWECSEKNKNCMHDFPSMWGVFDDDDDEEEEERTGGGLDQLFPVQMRKWRAEEFSGRESLRD